MPCFSPLKAYRRPGGGVAWSSVAGFEDLKIELPCGQCIGCRIERSRMWASRCVHEAATHDRSSFVTLTYSPEHLPSDGSLQITDWQKFAKRLRKKLGPFRFFMCGEYGDTNLRPHYHVLFFGLDFHQDRVTWKKKPHPLWLSPTLTDTWGKGHAVIGALTYQSAAYCARYVLKKVNGELAKTRYQRVDPETGEVFSVRPEFVTMSRRPGIGSKWFELFGGDVYPSDEVIIEGKRFRPPRFYDDKLPESQLNDLKKKRRRNLANRQDQLTPERLKTREKVLKAKLKQFNRPV